ERGRDAGGELWTLVVLEADAVADVIALEVGQAAGPHRREGRLEETRGGNTGRDGLERGFDAGLDGVERALLPRVWLAHHGHAAHVRAIALVDAAHVEANELTRAEGAVARPRRRNRAAVADGDDRRIRRGLALQHFAFEHRHGLALRHAGLQHLDDGVERLLRDV